MSATAERSTQQLLDQANVASQAWSTLIQVFQPWSTIPSPSPPSSFPLPSEPTLKSAFACVHSLGIASLLLSQCVSGVLQPWLTQQLIETTWWQPILSTLQRVKSNTSRGRRGLLLSARLDGLIVDTFTRVVQSMQQQLQPLLERIQLLDKIMASVAPPDASPQPLLIQFQRLMHALFTTSLSQPCTAIKPTVSRANFFHEFMFKYYRSSFRVFHRVAQPDEASSEEEMQAEDELAQADTDEMDEDENPLPVLEYSESTLTQFASTCSLLLSLHFLGSSSTPNSSDINNNNNGWMSPSYFLDFFFIIMEKYLRAKVVDVWDRDTLIEVNQWMEKRIKPFLHIILTGSITIVPKSKSSPPASSSFSHWYSRLHFYCMECFGSIRISEMFSLVKDYPDSLPALRNLAEILNITKQYPLLVRGLSREFKSRLLQPGTGTKIILEQYANTISCCRILDPLGHHNLLGGMMDESGIGFYVKQRSDGVRNVVRAMWGSMDDKKEENEDGDEEEKKDDVPAEDDADDPFLAIQKSSQVLADAADGGLDLSHELESVPEATKFGDDSDREEDAAPASAQPLTPGTTSHDLWHPDPIDSNQNEGGRTDAPSARYLRKADTLSLLIDLVGSSERNEELLLLEYKSFLSNRFLSKRSNAWKAGRLKSTAASSSMKSVVTQDVKDPLYDTDVEVTHLELMKLRFGDNQSALIDVEIMMKDIVNSKRIWVQLMAAANINAIPSPYQPMLANLNQLSPFSKLQYAILKQHESSLLSSSSSDSAPISKQSLIHSLNLAPNFTPLILSNQFWPNISEWEDDAFEFNLPPYMKSLQDSFAALFHELKTPRKIAFLNSGSGSGGGSGTGTGNESSGNVCSIELEMKDGRKEFIECETIHVAIIDLFAEHEIENGMDSSSSSSSSSAAVTTTEKTEWGLNELAEALGMDDTDVLKSKIQFWLQRGILRVKEATESDDPDDPIYQLVENGSGPGDDADEMGVGIGSFIDQDSDGNVRQKAFEEKQVEEYVLGALANYASMSIISLHNLLKSISASSGSGFIYTKNETELRLTLDSMQQRSLIQQQDGNYTKSKQQAAR